MEEIWRDIPDYEGLYQVSDLGNVKSLSRYILRNGKYPFKSEERFLSLCENNRGYFVVGLYKEGIKKIRLVHQLVAITFLNHIPCGYKLVVNHKNFIRTDNRLMNLEIVTNRENSNQKHLKSTSEYTGVSWNKSAKKWKSSIVINGKTKWLGDFDNELEASMYYENALVALKNGTEIKTKPNNFTSKYRGVAWNKKLEKWGCQIRLNGKLKHLGYFDDELEASEYYENAFIDYTEGREIIYKHIENTSKYKGVCWNNKSNKWMASIKVGEATKYIGLFDDETEASLYYENAVIAIEKGEEIQVKQASYSSKFTGVSWNESGKKWRSTIRVNNEIKNLGSFDTEEEAYQYHKNALLAIQNNTEIELKRRETSSNYRGVSWSKRDKKWRAVIKIGKDRKYLGAFKTELEAYEAVENALKQQTE